MFIIVVGCGRVGSELAFQLYNRGHQVAVIDQVGTSFAHLDPRYRGRTVAGEVLSEDLLRRAGIEQADGLAAVTNSDSVNAVVGHVARTIFRVPRVVVRNYDPRGRALHEAFGLSAVSSTAWGAQRIEELLYEQDCRSVFSAGNGEVEIYELAIPEGWGDHTLGEVLPLGACLPAAMTRAGKAVLPTRDTRLQGGDVIHVSATLDGIEALRRRLASPPGA